MDFPKSVPGVGLVNGKFVDENPVTGSPGSLIPAAWGNAVTDEILAVIAAAGLAPAEGQTAQLRDAIGLLVGSVASQAEAEGGTENTKRMTALRVFQAITKYGLGATSLPLLADLTVTTTATGMYRCDAGAPGSPVAEPGFVDIRREGAGLLSQRFYSRTSDRAFFRRGNGGLGAWKEHIHDGNLATAGDMAAGTSTTRPPSVAAVMSLFAKRTFAADDFVRIPDVPGGLIIQWGRVPNAAADGVQDVTFPVGFTTACRGMLACLQSAVASTNPLAVYAAPITLATGKVVRDVASSPYPAGEIFWLAFGN